MLQLKGTVLYNGAPLSDFLPERTAIYVEQEDQHLPELTVRETFDFAARCQGVGVQAGELHLTNIACGTQLWLSWMLAFNCPVHSHAMD